MTRTCNIVGTVNLFLILLLSGATCAYFYRNERRFAEQQMITWNLLMDQEIDLATRVSDLFEALDHGSTSLEARTETERAREFNRLAGNQIMQFEFREALASISNARAATINAENQLRCGDWHCPLR